MGIRHPAVHGAVFSASPGGGYRPLTGWRVRCRASTSSRARMQFFLDNAARWADALRDADVDVVMMERDGGHGGAFWGEEFPLMVAWAFGR